MPSKFPISCFCYFLFLPSHWCFFDWFGACCCRTLWKSLLWITQTLHFLSDCRLLQWRKCWFTTIIFHSCVCSAAVFWRAENRRKTSTQRLSLGKASEFIAVQKVALDPFCWWCLQELEKCHDSHDVSGNEWVQHHEIRSQAFHYLRPRRRSLFYARPEAISGDDKLRFVHDFHLNPAGSPGPRSAFTILVIPL